MNVMLDPSSNFHPYECDGPGKCMHCSRLKSERHDPETCALCDPDYDMAPNPYRKTSMGTKTRKRMPKGKRR